MENLNTFSLRRSRGDVCGCGLGLLSVQSLLQPPTGPCQPCWGRTDWVMFVPFLGWPWPSVLSAISCPGFPRPLRFLSCLTPSLWPLGLSPSSPQVPRSSVHTAQHCPWAMLLCAPAVLATSLGQLCMPGCPGRCESRQPTQQSLREPLKNSLVSECVKVFYL